MGRFQTRENVCISVGEREWTTLVTNLFLHSYIPFYIYGKIKFNSQAAGSAQVKRILLTPLRENCYPFRTSFFLDLIESCHLVQLSFSFQNIVPYRPTLISPTASASKDKMDDPVALIRLRGSKG